MKVGIVGLGRMGAGIRDRLRREGHEVVGFDANPDLTDVPDLAGLVAALEPPRVVWVMVPAGEPTEATLHALGDALESADLVVEGGNSYYRDSIRRAAALAEQGVDFVDAGVSGGVWGLEVGFCIMAGGAPAAVERVAPLFASLAPPEGWAHVGPTGSGHFVKMVHNGIEYGLMQAYAEGFSLLDAYDDDLDLHQVASLWQHGSVVRSWLLDLTVRALAEDPDLSGLKPYVEDSGEGRWTVLEAVERGVPADAIAHALFTRFASRDGASFGLRLEAALRQQFGGHRVERT